MDVANGPAFVQEGFVSERMVEGEIGSSIIECNFVEDSLGPLAIEDMARDMRRTINGRTCFPSDLV